MSEKILLKIILIAFCVLCLGTASDSGERAPKSARLSGPTRIDITYLERKIHDLINREREKKGLPALLWNEQLHDIARRHSRDMARRKFFSHYDPEGRSFCDRYKAAAFECGIRVGGTICLGAENISQDNLNYTPTRKTGKSFLAGSLEDRVAESVVKRWMNSKGHRKNILTPYFRRQGIGVSFSGDGEVYVTEDFC